MTPHKSATVFQVTNVEAALRYYTGVLGFTEDFRFGEYAGIMYGDVRIHLCGHNTQGRPVGAGSLYVFCDEVDVYFAAIKGKGALVKTEPKVYDYGMRDFTVLDPDGNHLSFGSDVD